MKKRITLDEMRLASVLPAGGGMLLVFGSWAAPHMDIRVGVSTAVVMTGAGFMFTKFPLGGRVMATAALVAWTVAALPELADSPAAALSVWLPMFWLLSALWIVPGLPARPWPGRVSGVDAARFAGIRVALRSVALLAVAVALSDDHSLGSSRAGLGLSLLSLAAWTMRARPRRSLERRWLVSIAATWLLGVVVILLGRDVGDVVAVLLLLVVLITSTLIRPRHFVGGVATPWWDHLLDHPARQLVSTFLFLILLGSLLLKLPAASVGEQPIALIDAVFTAVSAVCVTGLIVVDTPVAWSGWGQAIILMLIQLGGLGIMSFATALVVMLGQRLPVRQEGAFAQIASGENRRDLYHAVKTVLVVTFAVELLGALILLPRFIGAGDELGQAIWRSVFTAVSAFCNAGFALQSDSLMGYAGDPWVLHATGILIVLGGLSPAVVVWLLRRHRPVSLQTRLVLWTSASLLVVGTLLFAASEWNNVLAGFGFWDRVHNAWFQSVTLRTAGFNSVDIAALRPATITFCVLWMFIGGSPGGTAGGIKTTTIAVLMLAVSGTVQGHRTVTVFGRAIAHSIIYRAASVATIGCLSLVLFVLAIQLTQSLEVVSGVFEVVSALGTVGLSMGATASLDAVGKIIIMTAMFAGRVGSLSLIAFLVAQRPAAPWRVLEENVAVG